MDLRLYNLVDRLFAFLLWLPVFVIMHHLNFFILFLSPWPCISKLSVERRAPTWSLEAVFVCLVCGHFFLSRNLLELTEEVHFYLWLFRRFNVFVASQAAWAEVVLARSSPRSKRVALGLLANLLLDMTHGRNLQHLIFLIVSIASFGSHYERFIWVWKLWQHLPFIFTID